MRLNTNINRSGLAPNASANSSVPGVIPPSPDTPTPSGMENSELVLMDGYGVVWNPEDVVQSLEQQSEFASVYYAMIVAKVSETESQLNYRLVLPLELDALSEPFGTERRKVTIRVKYPPIRSTARGAAVIMTLNIPYLDQKVLRSKEAVFVPYDVDMAGDGKTSITWAKDISLADTSVAGVGTITRTKGAESNKFLLMRTPLCNMMEAGASVARLTPELELYWSPNMESTSIITDLGYPIALSQDGTKIYFICYRSHPRGDAPENAPILSYGFCTPDAPFTSTGEVAQGVEALANVVFLTLGPEDNRQ